MVPRKSLPESKSLAAFLPDQMLAQAACCCVQLWNLPQGVELVVQAVSLILMCHRHSGKSHPHKAWMAFMRRSVWSGRPAEMRMKPLSSGLA